MPNEGEDFSTGGGERLRLPPGYFMQYVAPNAGPAPDPAEALWILRGPDGLAVAQYAPGAATKGAVEGAAAEHRRSVGR
ncbi:MAG: hypothetical protein AVDCRST_MAG01-01-2909 [uncultured Rubrobacteraceae bacterium]|uniref:Uncharacterized protein n=1 Tax=uncultured Rubrobacteraceae bacterium TaxID=349277 RepID=A0A6J4Q0C9_9ACTN|nr:MAG: hypothetical protein AVDCRST_MAG01-01-2909 [uncultured Rubrobacteraceae bacterium]